MGMGTEVAVAIAGVVSLRGRGMVALVAKSTIERIQGNERTITVMSRRSHLVGMWSRGGVRKR